MSSRSSWFLPALLSLIALTGCHRARVIAPPPPPAVHVAMISVPPPSHPSEPEPAIPLVDVTRIEPNLPRRTTPRYRPPAVSPSKIAALTPPPAPIDLGQLTAGGEQDNQTLRQQTEALLRGQQRRLSALPRKFAALHSQQVQQARLFLRQADDAWKKLDVEGARTLATKAKVLLDELQA